MSNQEIKDRLEYLRIELREERISWEEIGELQQLAEHIDPSDVELLEAAGISEHPVSMKTFTITIEGKSQSDIELALQEVMNSIQSGCHCGTNSNDDGSFSFESEGEYNDE